MKTLGLQNVKAFADTGDIEIAPITIIVGRNSCGKSSFIRFPQVLAQTFSSGYDTPIYLNGTQNDSIDYGTFQEVLHNGKGDHFSVSLSYSIKQRAIVDRSERRKSNICRLAKIVITYSKPPKEDGKTGTKVYATQIKIYLDDCLICCLDKINDTNIYNIKLKKTIIDEELVDFDYEYQVETSLVRNFMPSVESYDLWKKFRGKLSRESMEKVNESYRYYSLGIQPESNKRELTKEEKQVVDILRASSIAQKLFDYLFALMRDEFLNLKYIGPFRVAPKRYYRANEIAYDAVGITGDNTSSILINNDSNVVKKVSEWFKEALHYSIKVNELGTGTSLYQILAVDEKTKRESNLMDVGYGISQVLPIVTQLVSTQVRNKQTANNYSRESIFSPSEEIYVIEQPELHLHPAAQSELASLFASTVINVEKRGAEICLLIETHSEHLVRALQYLIASPDYSLTHEMVKFYYVDKAENGASTIWEMKTNEYGQFLEKWPTGFFDEAHVMSRKLLDTIADRKYEEALKGDQE